MILPSTHTERVNELLLNDLLDSEVIIIADNISEDRGELELWKEMRANSVNRVILIKATSEYDEVEISVFGQHFQTISLRKPSEIAKIFNGERFLIDITSFRHNVWAPIVSYVRKSRIPCRVIYSEPKEYKKHPSPSSETTFDLTTSFEGMLPLPGFAKIDGPEENENTIFVPLLGFEGSRPVRLLANIEPEPKAVAIVGVPGFQLEYPTHTITCNRRLFSDYNVRSNIRYARASCPFEAYEALEDIQRDYPDNYLYIAPVGTKPHALGAVLFAIDNPESTELLYDNPVVKSGRTKGRSKIHIYNLNHNA